MIGVIIFSGSLPATRAAVLGFTPLFVTSARAVIAALLGGICLASFRQTRPARRDILPLVFVAAGVVVGFPLLTGLALQHITAARSVVFVALLPMATAIFATVRGGDRPRLAFWFFAAIGAAAVAGFALFLSDATSTLGDALMLGAIALCGFGYAEGATLSRRIGGWQVISWALLLSLPPMISIAVATMPVDLSHIGIGAWIGLGYVSIFSMLIGFVFWYRGLALGGTAGVAQVQLLQPFLGLALASVVLREPVSWAMLAIAALVVLCVAGSRRFA